MGSRGEVVCPSWPPNDPEWRADKDGSVRRPKRRNDEERLKQFFECCREAWTPALKGFLLHHPYLFGLTDRYGCAALHHATMSGSVEFVAALLEVYSDPRTFERRFVVYGSPEELRKDGLRLCGPFKHALCPDGEPPPGSVQAAPGGSRAHASGVRPGDVLERVDGSRVAGGLRRSLPTLEEVARACSGADTVKSHSFPLTLTFTRPAHADVLAQESWGFLGAASCIGPGFRQIRRMLHAERQRLDAAVSAAATSAPVDAGCEAGRVASAGSRSAPAACNMGACRARRPPPLLAPPAEAAALAEVSCATPSSSRSPATAMPKTPASPAAEATPGQQVGAAAPAARASSKNPAPPALPAGIPESLPASRRAPAGLARDAKALDATQPSSRKASTGRAMPALPVLVRTQHRRVPLAPRQQPADGLQLPTVASKPHNAANAPQLQVMVKMRPQGSMVRF